MNSSTRLLRQRVRDGFRRAAIASTWSFIAPAAFWLSADQVVEASLAGLEKGKLFVIPGWRYRLLTALVSKLPSDVRILVESARRGRSRVSLPNAETNGPGKSIEQGTRSDHSAPY